MSKPTKFTQIVPGDNLSTCAPLPATVNNDQRSSNLLGTEGCFIAAGPMARGIGVLSFPNAVTTLTADQIFGTWVTVTGAGANNITTPTAAQIVAFLTTQFARVPTVAFPNTGTGATPVQYYPGFRFTLSMVGTSALVMGTGCLYYVTGTSASAGTTGALVAGSNNSYEVIVTNATPGAEAVAFLRV